MVEKRQTKPSVKKKITSPTIRKNSHEDHSLHGYTETLSDLVSLLETARQTTVRSVNAIMTSTYWLIGKRILEQEQKGETRAEYGEELVVSPYHDESFG